MPSISCTRASPRTSTTCGRRCCVDSGTAAHGSGAGDQRATAVPGAEGPSAIDHLRTALAGVGAQLSATEIADVLWLALQRAPVAEREPDPVRSRREVGPRAVASDDAIGDAPVGRVELEQTPPPAPEDWERWPATELEGEAALPGPSRSVHGLAGHKSGSGASAIRMPRVSGLPQPMAIVRSLRFLKRRVSSPYRFELDESATAEASANNGALSVVLRPERIRWLDLVLAVDDGLAMSVWQDTVSELGEFLGNSGIFRTVRQVSFEGQHSVGSAVVDANRTVVLVLSTAVGENWHPGGTAREALVRWARKAPTAMVQPLPRRMWSGTAVSPQRMRVRSNRSIPSNHLLQAYDPWLPAVLAPRPALPVPVLELGAWSIAPWAKLMGSRGSVTTLHIIDAEESIEGPPSSVRPGATPEEQVTLFRENVGPEAYELAGHLAAVDPLTLPIMRLVQAAVLPDSGPSCLSEVLLSDLMRVDRSLGGFDVFGFAPGVRSLLKMVVRASEAQRTVDAVTAFIAPRLGRARDFPALLADRMGTLDLSAHGAPFAEMSVPVRSDLPPRPARLSEQEESALRLVERSLGQEASPVVLRGHVPGPRTTALEYAHLHASEFSRIHWMPLDSTASVRQATAILRGRTDDSLRTPGLVILDSPSTDDVVRPLVELIGLHTQVLIVEAGAALDLPYRVVEVDSLATTWWERHALRQDTDGRLRGQLGNVLPWLGEQVSIAVLRSMWPGASVTRVLLEMVESGIIEVDWERQLVRLDADIRAEHFARAKPVGRDLAASRLIIAYDTDESFTFDGELDGHTLALADATPADEDTESTADVFVIASRRLMGRGLGGEGVRLGERACAAAEAPLALISASVIEPRAKTRRQLVVDAIDNGLRSFIALSTVSIDAYRRESRSSRAHDLAALQPRLSRAVTLPPGERTRGGAARELAYAREMCEQLLGIDHRLTADVAEAEAAMLVERPPGSGQT
ncbi:SAV_2336 N-terminal domain-related protein [Actinacidiphila alni]|uniref:SAV_2336 N-terminal domain-related protein n=1 Tax=Actinacidiphila alni TaxID=380248 RepID=UPI0034516BC9